MTNAELVQTYVALLIIEYSDPNNTPNAIATITMLANEAIANQIVGQVYSGFSLTGAYGQPVAQGVQLNILGQFVGAMRFLPTYNPSILLFGMQDTTGSYNPDAGGYDDSSSATPPTDYWDSTTQTFGSGYTLSDAQMIQLIQFLAEVNNAYLSLQVIDEILFDYFGPYVTVAEGAPNSLVLTYTQSASDPGTLFGIVNYLDAFPHPAGVAVDVVPG